MIIQNLPLRLDRRVRNECRALVEAGYAVSVICPKETPDEVDRHTIDGAVVYSYNAPEGAHGLASYAREFVICWLQTARLSLRVNQEQPFDVLQACNPPDTYWLLGALWKLRGRSYVFDQHDLCPEVFEARFGTKGLLHRGLLLLEAATYRVADRVIAPNPEYRQMAIERGRVPIERTAVVMSTPDPDLMKREQSHPELRGNREFLVCYVGIMGPQDGVDSLLAAIDAYVHEVGRLDTHFALLGFGDSLEELQADCTRRRLDEWVTFTGRVDHEELGRWLSTADIGIIPDPPCEFNQRSTMNKTLEYMAHEVPIVATDLRETRRCAADAAVYVSGFDPTETAVAISELLDDPQERERMEHVGRDRIEHELAWQIQADNYIGVFDDLMSASPEVHPLPSAT
ncbi:glycosyltransferase family 4 protein [Ornithinimicrobium ciconiae]|uniref:D-inositol 3-phosphate glycosyltransferase n=1 Tax=Ornithinimicrobium ciconiae TaxID=2594265 RepID=A0A516GFA2_9MICO|nr:glycosyltransferase family 4 protein [Ornithinimicrobium ciconiae]